LSEVAGYAAGIGPWIGQIHGGLDEAGRPRLSGVVTQAWALHLLVHPYTFRRDHLAAGFGKFDDLLRTFIDGIGIDGLFTDFPDLVVRYLAARETSRVSARASGSQSSSRICSRP
jgi:glycerophosphoryl diester phosphodiesterase